MTQPGSSPLADFIAVSNRLTDLMTAEVAALRAMRPKDIAPLQEEKAQLTERYGQYLKAFRADERAIRVADPETRGRVREATTRLRQIVVEDSRALDAARTVNERLVRAVADIVTRKSAPAAGYSATGKTDASPVARGDAVLPVTLNKEI